MPACAVWPGVIEAGRQTEQLNMTMDIYPTLCQIAGLQTNHPIEGESFLSLLKGDRSPHRTRDMIWMRREGNMRYQGRDYYAFRRGDWKLVQNTPFEPYALYNLANDPLETTDISRDHQAVHRMLIRALMNHVQEAGSIPWQAPGK